MLEVALALAYGVSAYFAWRVPGLSSLRRAIFAGTVFPVFFGFMFVSLWLVDNFLPHLLESFNQAHREAQELIKQGVRARKASRQADGMAMLITVPVAIVGAICCYLLLRVWESRSTKARRGRRRI